MLSIGQLAQETGTKVPTIRYYEQIGLMPEPRRTGGQQRRYGADAVRRLNFIRHSRELGFPPEDVRELLGLIERADRPCAGVDAIARRNLIEVRRRIDSLQTLERELARMVEECSGGRISYCRVVDVLSDHAHCRHRAH